MRIRIWAAIWPMFVIGWSSPSLCAEASWPSSLTIGTASPGGVYLVYGNALAPILTNALGLPVTAQATQGPDQNILLLESGNVQLAFVTMGTALQGWNGTGAWTHGNKLRSMRALFPMYDTPFQFVALESSGIRTLPDMADKRIGGGPQGGTGGSYASKIFEALGIPGDGALWRLEQPEHAAAIRDSSTRFSARRVSHSRSLPSSTAQSISALSRSAPTRSRSCARQCRNSCRRWCRPGLTRR